MTVFEEGCQVISAKPKREVVSIITHNRQHTTDERMKVLFCDRKTLKNLFWENKNRIKASLKPKNDYVDTEKTTLLARYF